MYLSWSVYHLVLILVLLWVPYIANVVFIKYKTFTLKKQVLGFVCCLPLIAVASIDVGTKQKFLDRQSFDIVVESSEIERVKVNTPNRDSVALEFKTTIEARKVD